MSVDAAFKSLWNSAQKDSKKCLKMIGVYFILMFYVFIAPIKYFLILAVKKPIVFVGIFLLILLSALLYLNYSTPY